MTDEELKGLFDVLRQENAAAHAETRSVLRQENAAAHAETRSVLRQENATAHTETRRHFDIALEAARHEIRLVAEGVAQTREEVSRKVAALEEQTQRVASETQAMIKFSHAELDRRMRTLEEGFADLQARVERLESSTH